ncbi:MAG: hypothetical protein A2Z32_11800 [Chloroflexi bacterium RBG_16_69_14]|nr:MAG: hypothetical protein A2Z32_11800 [Chloroflexi bacterium RBG_16_69_14]
MTHEYVVDRQKAVKLEPAATACRAAAVVARYEPHSWYAKQAGLGPVALTPGALDHARRPSDPRSEQASFSPSTNQDRTWRGLRGFATIPHPSRILTIVTVNNVSGNHS